jgi:hypothetical protein
MATRRSGVAAVFLPTAPTERDLAHLQPTVLAGRPADLVALLSGPAIRELGAVRTVLITGEVPDVATRAKIVRLLGHATSVIAAWSPPGVRAMWAECSGGTGFHTWPAAEIVEIVNPKTFEPVEPGEPGELVWSALGWAGTVVLRLRTGVRAKLDEATCPSCKRTSPRVIPVAAIAPFAPVLDSHPGVAAWQGELSRRNGSEELVVYLAPSRPGHPGRLIRELDEQLEPTHAVQFIVLSPEAIARRLAEHDNETVVRLR